MTSDFTTTRSVTFAETDMAGVMHFSNYYRIMEEVEHAFWRSRGLNVVIQNADAHISWPRRRTSCEFRKPVRFEDCLECHFSIIEIGERSIDYQIQFRCQDKLVALGKATIVCCKVQDGQFESIPIPEDVRAGLEGKG